ncbi:MAG: DUF4900 domain-containing protein [Candidatus Omnitrophica bacterium]|nr:DUF4900 domain-containing protein [Candidatus Omnitrophota bacterium]
MKVKKRGIVLVVSLIIMAVLLVLVGMYLSSLLTEKRAADRGKFVLQALELAEAGASHAQSELRQRIRQTMRANLSAANVNQAGNNLANYFNAPQPLGLLQDYAGFSIIGNTANIFLGPINLTNWGNYWSIVTVAPNGNPQNPDTDVYVFSYNYSIEAQGLVTQTTPNTTRRVGLSQGTFSVTVQRGNFARYALFTNHHRTAGGTTVWFTANTNFTGPVHSNERFSFANNPSATFSEAVTQHLSTARFYNNGATRLLNADSNPACCQEAGCEDTPCIDKPIFNAGFTRGADEINLPSSVVQQDLLNQATGGQNDGPWANGIYLPNDGANNLVGGIYIKGNASNVTMSVDSDNPVYTITRGTNTKRITVDYSANQTTVENVSGSGGTPPGTYNGIPNGIGDAGIIIYDNGSISNFSGNVQSDTQLTVASNSDISISNHIMYESFTPDDVGTSENELSVAGFTNLLGIVTWNGNVRISTGAPNNLNIHAVVMAAGRNGVFTVDNYNSGAPRGVVTLLGGAITDFYGAFGTFSGSNPVSGYGRNFVYDSRMLGGMAPPYFPTITSFDANVSDANGDGVDDLGNRLIWEDRGV